MYIVCEIVPCLNKVLIIKINNNENKIKVIEPVQARQKKTDAQRSKTMPESMHCQNVVLFVEEIALRLLETR